MIKSKILATGSYLPKKILTNDDLAKIIDTSDEWIVERTGIKSRHVAAEDELTSDLGTKAALDALKKGNIEASQIDLIIVATTTADNIFPAVATKIQAKISEKTGQKIIGAAFDVQAVCSGFVYALCIADKFIKSGQNKNILVIGAETLTRILNWEDRNSCVLFGDGAGAVILSATEEGDSDILDSELHSDGSLYDILNTDGGPSMGGEGKITMQGKEVFKNAVTKMSATVNSLLAKNSYEAKDIDIVVPHQANQRILSSVQKKLGLKDEQIISTVATHANTSAASIPLAMDYAVTTGKMKRGDLVVLEALGAGLTWGSILLKY